jgi:hypothetical protein
MISSYIGVDAKTNNTIDNGRRRYSKGFYIEIGES